MDSSVVSRDNVTRCNGNLHLNSADDRTEQSVHSQELNVTSIAFLGDVFH